MGGGLSPVFRKRLEWLGGVKTNKSISEGLIFLHVKPYTMVSQQTCLRVLYPYHKLIYNAVSHGSKPLRAFLEQAA